MATERKPVSIAEFEAEIRDLDGNSTYKNIMLFGGSGSGKTVLAGSAPNSLILACEPGYISAARVSLNRLGQQKRQYRIIPDAATALAAMEWLENGGIKKRGYKWVIVDGMTTLETKIRLGYAAEAWDANPAKRQHRNLPDKPDYLNTQNFIRGWVARLVDLPVNTLITAHHMVEKNEIMPAFQQREGALSQYVSGLMHVVGHTRKVVLGRGTEEERTVWRVQFDPRQATIDGEEYTYFGKDQFNALGRYLDNTSIPAISEMIDNSPANSDDVASAQTSPSPARKRAPKPAARAGRPRRS